MLILAYAGMQIIDIAGPAQVLAEANLEGAIPRYDVTLVSAGAAAVPTSSGLVMAAGAIPTAGDLQTLVVPGGPGVHDARRDVRLTAAIASLAARAERVCAVCTGAFLLAEAGLLDGRAAVTHWRSCNRLSREFPAVKVNPDPLFLNDGPIWTTAGVTAGIDLMLNMVRQDHGAALAGRVARGLVVYMRRTGGQKQFSEPLALQIASTPAFERLIDQMVIDPGRPWTVDRMAEVSGQSLRTFHRRFRAATGISPAEAIEKIRCELARALLHTSELTAPQIAAKSGFSSQAHLRRAMTRQYGKGPGEMRERFS